MTKIEPVEGMIIASLDQDWASMVDGYDRLGPIDRGELALWLTRHDGRDLRDAPEWVRGWVLQLASAAFLEAAFRWRKDQEADE